MISIAPFLQSLALVAAIAPFSGAQPKSFQPDAPPKPTTRYVVAVIGDSLSDPRAGGAKYIEGLRSRCPQSQFDLYAGGGQRTTDMRRFFVRNVFGATPRVSARKPRYTHVLVLGGVNDLLARSVRDGSTKHTQENLAFMYETARKRGLGVIALTVPPWGRLPGVKDRRVEATERLNAWILDQEGAGHVDHAVDIYPLLSCGDPQVLCPTFRRFKDDLVHWGPPGHEVVAHKLAEQVFYDCL